MIPPQGKSIEPQGEMILPQAERANPRDKVNLPLAYSAPTQGELAPPQAETISPLAEVISPLVEGEKSHGCSNSEAVFEKSGWRIPLRFALVLPLDESPAAENGGLSSALSVIPTGKRPKKPAARVWQPWPSDLSDGQADQSSFE